MYLTRERMFRTKERNVVPFISQRKCLSCECCAEACSRGVIRMYYDERHSYASVEFPQKCTGCGRCVRACRISAIELIKKSE